MNENRRSKRPSTVIKRKELEEKLDKRKNEAELKEEKSRSRESLKSSSARIKNVYNWSSKVK